MPMTLSGNGTITGLVAGGLPDASITGSDLASGAAAANLPGSTVNGSVSFNGNVNSNQYWYNSSPYGRALMQTRGSWLVQGGGSLSSFDSRTATEFAVNGFPHGGREYYFDVNIGTDGLGQTRRAFYLQVPFSSTSSANVFTSSFTIDVYSGTWNWGQSVGIRKFGIGSASNSWTNSVIYTYNRAAMDAVTVSAGPTGTSYYRVGIINTSGRNNFAVKLCFFGNDGVFDDASQVRCAVTDDLSFVGK